MRRPYYFPDDSHALLILASQGMYMRFASKAILGHLKRMRELGQAHHGLLRQYPSIRYEPLAFFYQCRQGIDALDEHLFDDLLNGYSWREANWAVWLAALAPNPRWVERLRAKRPHLPHAALTLDLALLAAGADLAEPMHEHVAALNEVRALLQLLPPMAFPMRLALPDAQQARFDAECTALRRAYLRADTAATTALLRQGLIGYYGQSRQAWIRDGASAIPSL